MSGSVAPVGYAELLAAVKEQVRTARLRAHRVVNTELLQLYWAIGHVILDRQAAEGWGARVIDRLAQDLRAEFLDMRGLSRTNLKYMRQPPGRAQLANSLLDNLPGATSRCCWTSSSTPPEATGTRPRPCSMGGPGRCCSTRSSAGCSSGSVRHPRTFAQHLAELDSELAQELTKDPYVFDFLNLTERAREKDVEAALMGWLQETLLEFGRGFAYVGRQVHFDVEGADFYVDLLLFHVEQLRYVVIELKIGKFKPDHLGQLGFYVAVVDDRLRRPGLHSPTVGILLCAGRNDAVVHALANTTAPMAATGYTSSPVDPDQLNLPRRAELEAILAIPVTERADATLPDEEA